jgi:hypothetical protein
MEKVNYILVTQFCHQAHMEYAFLEALITRELIAFETEANEYYILMDQVGEIERMHRLHKDLGVNADGIGVVNEMLERISGMEKEIRYLRQKLEVYEG